MAIPIRQKIVIAAIIFYATFAWTAAAHAAILKPTNNLGLTGYWNLDEGKGTTAYDRSTGGHNGTLTSSPTWTSGKLGQALTFGAANNYVVTTAPWPSSGSISAWVYPTTYADWISPAGWKTDPNTSTDGYMLFDEGGAGTPGKWRFVARPNVGGAAEAAVVASASITQNAWQHIVGTWSLSGTTYTMHLYVNGVDQGTNTWTGTPGSSGLGGFNFGKSGDYADNYFKGKVDEVRIYNRALPLNEVRALYNRTIGTRYNASTATLSNGSALQNGLVGWWTFDGSTVTTTVQDSSSSGLNGYVSTTVATSSMKVGGKLGQALSFASGTHINTPGTNVSAPCTMTGWVYIQNNASTAHGYPLLDSGQYSARIQQVSATIVGETAYGVADYTFSPTYTVPQNRWTFLAFVNNTGTATLYANGVLQGTISATLGCPRTFVAGNITDYFSGKLDDVRVYSRVLSTAEVVQLYQEGAVKVASGTTLQNGTTLATGLLGYWSFNGADVADKVYDRGGGNNGYFPSGISTSSAKVQGKLGQALNFNGSSSYVDFGDVQDQTGSFSLSAWVKRMGDSTGQAGTVIGKEMSSNHQFELEIIDSDTSNANKVRFNLFDVDTTQYSTATIQNGKWYHLVATYDDTTKAKVIYINGVSDSTVTGSGSPVANSDSLKIGFSQGTSNASNYFNGSIDEVRIYNRALSVAEVTQLYQLGK